MGTKIARCIPGKTHDECLARYRHIVQLVKAKKSGLNFTVKEKERT